MALTPSLKLLKYISKHPHITAAQLLSRFNIIDVDLSDCLTPAYFNEHLQIIRDERNPQNSQFLLTETGKIYLDHLSQKSRDFWIPTIIAILALLKSFDYEISAVLQILMQLLTG